MTQPQPIPKSPNEERRAGRLRRVMGRVLGKARGYLLMLPRRGPARADETGAMVNPQKRLSVHRLHPNSLKEEESLTVNWANGQLTVTYARHDSPGSDEMFLETWDAECSEPRETRRRHRSGNLRQELDDSKRRK
jgi:hypothetical protein